MLIMILNLIMMVDCDSDSASEYNSDSGCEFLNSDSDSGPDAGS